MDVGLLFWFLMIIVGISIIGGYTFLRDNIYITGFSTVLTWVLFALLGWKVFGPIIH